MKWPYLKFSYNTEFNVTNQNINKTIMFCLNNDMTNTNTSSHFH